MRRCGGYTTTYPCSCLGSPFSSRFIWFVGPLFGSSDPFSSGLGPFYLDPMSSLVFGPFFSLSTFGLEPHYLLVHIFFFFLPFLFSFSDLLFRTFFCRLYL